MLFFVNVDYVPKVWVQTGAIFDQLLQGVPAARQHDVPQRVLCAFATISATHPPPFFLLLFCWCYRERGLNGCVCANIHLLPTRKKKEEWRLSCDKIIQTAK
jgi:hypothetical protein